MAARAGHRSWCRPTGCGRGTSGRRHRCPDPEPRCASMTAPIEVTPAAAAADPDAVLAGISGREIQGRSLGQIAWMRLRRDKVAMAGGVTILVLILIAIIGPYFVQNPDIYHANLINPTFSRPNGP